MSNTLLRGYNSIKIAGIFVMMGIYKDRNVF